MKKQPQDQRDWHERRIEEQREKDRAAPLPAVAKESKASIESFPERTRKPGEVGLANEARPGLGSRSDAAAGAEKPKAVKKPKTKGKPTATKRGYEEPRPEPREQSPDSLAHEQERQTGMSGQSSGA